MTSGALPDLGDRPDPVAQASVPDAMEPRAGRGKLRTYLGIAPGSARPGHRQPRPASRSAAEQDRRLLGDLHGTLAEVRAGDTASGLIRAAYQAGACQLVIGSPRRSRWSRLLNGSTVADQVLRAAGDLPVQVVNVGRPGKTSSE